MTELDRDVSALDGTLEIIEGLVETVPLDARADFVECAWRLRRLRTELATGVLRRGPPCTTRD